MEQTSGYDFASIGNETTETNQEMVESKQPFPTVKFIIMLVTGIIAIMISPWTLAAIGLIQGFGIMIAIMLSLAVGGTSGYLGERLIKKGWKLGWIGIGFAGLVILMILLPIISTFVFAL